MWHVEPERRAGFLELPSLEAKVDIARPQAGLSEVQCQGVPLQAHLLQVELSGEPAQPVQDCYVRLQDLVITYEPVEQQLRPQIYWRSIVESRPWLRGVELILSVQTELLDCDPHTLVHSAIEADRAFYLSHGDTLLEVDTPELELDAESAQPLILLTGPFGSYLEMAIPGDFSHLQLHRSDRGWHTAWKLFPDSLEKGVIRRGRIRGVFSIGGLSAADAGAILEEFLATPLPLTT